MRTGLGRQSVPHLRARFKRFALAAAGSFHLSSMMLVQNWSKNANWGRGVIFPKYQPEISYLDPIQPIFDKSCKHNILLKFLENPHKSPLQGSGSSRTMIFPIIAPTKMSNSGIGLTWGPIFEIQKKVQRVPFLVK